MKTTVFRALAATGMATALAAGIGTAPAAANDSPIRFSNIGYHAPGWGHYGGLNSEYVRLQNYGRYPTNLHGWHFSNRLGHRYTFPSSYYLHPGRAVTIRTGWGRNSHDNFYWNRRHSAWNHRGHESARLYNSGNSLIDSCDYVGQNYGVVNC